MEIINALGLACPAPVIEAKKAIARLGISGGSIAILADNQIACENLSKMCSQKGYGYLMQKKADKQYEVTITVGEGASNPQAADATADEVYEDCAIPNQNGLVVAIGQDKMGSGDDALGKILIKGFIYSLANLEIPPKAVLFFNSGVRLTLSESNTLDDLKALAAKGTSVFVCGTCVDFYGCKERVSLGEITNMYNIVEQMRTAAKVINI